MAFEQLMEHAYAIQAKAISRAHNDIKAKHGVMPAEYAGGVERYYADIPELFRSFSEMPDPRSYADMIGDVDAIMRELCVDADSHDPVNKGTPYTANPEMEKLASGGILVPSWSGPAAREFRGNFLSSFRAHADNHFLLVGVVKGGLEAHAAMWRAARNDIDQLAHTFQEALDNASCDKNSWTVAFTVVASVTALTAALATGPASPFAGGRTYSGRSDRPDIGRYSTGQSGGEEDVHGTDGEADHRRYENGDAEDQRGNRRDRAEDVQQPRQDLRGGCPGQSDEVHDQASSRG